MGDTSSQNAPRRSGAELLEQELDRLRKAASGPGLVSGGPELALGGESSGPSASPQPASAVQPQSGDRPALRLPFESWVAMIAAVVFGLLLVRLVNWVFDIPTETLDLRSEAPMSARGYQLLLLSLAIGVTLVVFADVFAAIRAALGSRALGSDQALGCCGILAATLVAHPWDAAVWLAQGTATRHTVREVTAVLLAAAAVFWLYPRASRLTHTLIAGVVVWELLGPYRLGWVELPNTDWLGQDPDSAVNLLRYAALLPATFTIVAAYVLLSQGSGPPRKPQELLGMLAFCLGAALLVPWSRYVWSDPMPQEHQLVGWALAGALILAQGVFLLAPNRRSAVSS